jgi:hypothetical protein
MLSLDELTEEEKEYVLRNKDYYKKDINIDYRGRKDDPFDFYHTLK